MQKTHLPRQSRAVVYPWELTEETKAVGRAGLARVRSILHAKQEGPAQLALELDFSSPAAPAPQARARRSRMAA